VCNDSAHRRALWTTILVRRTRVLVAGWGRGESRCGDDRANRDEGKKRFHGYSPISCRCISVFRNQRINGVGLADDKDMRSAPAVCFRGFARNRIALIELDERCAMRVAACRVVAETTGVHCRSGTRYAHWQLSVPGTRGAICGVAVDARLNSAAFSLTRRCDIRSCPERRAKAKGFVAPSPDGRGAALYLVLQPARIARGWCEADGGRTRVALAT
jgi:hypothetical protein